LIETNVEVFKRGRVLLSPSIPGFERSLAASAMRPRNVAGRFIASGSSVGPKGLAAVPALARVKMAIGRKPGGKVVPIWPFFWAFFNASTFASRVAARMAGLSFFYSRENHAISRISGSVPPQDRIARRDRTIYNRSSRIRICS
jgi:hypothetical protein